MNIWTRLFHRKSKEQMEVNYRMSMAKLRRDAASLKSQADAAGKEALRLEQQGDHSQALIKAMQCENLKKNYALAMKSISQNEAMHIKAKTQTMMIDVMEACRDMSHTVLAEADLPRALKAQEDLQKASILMDENMQAIDAFQQGFDLNANSEEINQAGEDALRALMQEEIAAQEKKAAEATLPAADAMIDQQKKRQLRDELSELMHA